MWPPDYLNCEERLQSGTSLLQFNSLGPIKIDVKVTKKDLEIMVVDYHKRNELLLFVRVCQYQNRNLTGSGATSRRRLHPNAERTHTSALVFADLIPNLKPKVWSDTIRQVVTGYQFRTKSRTSSLCSYLLTRMRGRAHAQT